MTWRRRAASLLRQASRPSCGMIEITEDLLLGGRVRLAHPARGHRAGTDAVLLAASAPVTAGDRVVDVGAATGAVGLMAAAREPAGRFVFVEREPALAERSEERRVGKECRSRWSPHH